MKKIKLLSILSFILTISISCSSDDNETEQEQGIEIIQLRTQQEVDDFGTNTPSINPNRLVIGDFENSNTSITNLDALTNLTSIGDLLIQRNNSLVNLNGLSNLTNINADILGRLVIENNPLITNLNGLNNLQNISGYFNILNNQELSNLCGLTTLFANQNFGSDGTFNTIENNAYNPTQQDILDGSCYFNEFNGSIQLKTQQEVDDFGNQGYTHITGDLHIGDLANQQGNTSITNLNILNTIVSINGAFYIYENFSLVNLEGLNNLMIVNGISQNPYLGDGFNVLNNGLTDFCALQTLMNNDIDVIFSANANTYNPTKQDIIDGNCSQ